jgi:hypothetical protein
LGLTVAFAAMAASFILASACVFLGQLHRIAVHKADGTIAHTPY